MTTTTALLDTAAEVAAIEAPAKKAGRPAKHADAAAKQRAWRAANKVVTIRLDGKLGASIAKLAEQFDVDQTTVINNMLRFAQTNRNWSQAGVTGWDMSDKRFANGKRITTERDPSLDSFPLC